ncbi:glycosyltransferase [Methylocapsa acidiphila]|uniref:glycosyltransferase n=1 Tax=Methylocapsa acidiphila TaxID=133552 RepID=UPI001FDA290C|nr:glycosyltransferase [Methylocapsa acidiphila]
MILTVNPEFGGPIEGIMTSAGILREQGCDREILSLDSPDDPWVKSCPLPVHPMGIAHRSYPKWRKRLPWLRYGYTPHFVPWLRENARRYDAIVVNGLWNYSSFGAWRALSKLDARYFVYPHGMLDPYFNKIQPVKRLAKQVLWWFSEGPLIANAARVMFVTEEERQLARHSFWPYRGRDQVAPYGIIDVAGDPAAQAAQFRSLLPRLGERDFLLFLSRIHPKKGCDLLIEAFAEVAAREPGLDLVMAGPDSVGWGQKLQDLAAARGISDRVHWPGMLKGDLKWGAFHATRAFVLPSHQENFGIVVAEAMACGKPVLTTTKVATWREVDESAAGFVERDDRAGIIRLLERFLALSAEERAAMGQRARQGFVEKFDIGAFAPKLIEILRTS